MSLIVVDPRNGLAVNPDHIASMQMVKALARDTYLRITMIGGTAYEVRELGDTPANPLNLDAIHKKIIMAATKSITIDFGASFDNSIVKQLYTPEGRELLKIFQSDNEQNS